MRALEGRRALRLSRDVVEPLADNHRTLREHYRRKRERYEVDVSMTYDRRLDARVRQAANSTRSVSPPAASCAK